MSRHRFVRGLDVASAGDDYEPLSDGGEDENEQITPEQLAQMNSVREHIRAVIGAPKPSGISDKEIDDASWEFYFDLDQTMDHILEIQGKRNAAKERQDLLNASEETTSTEPVAVLSKLQKLSLAKQAGLTNTPKSLASLARSAQAQRSMPLNNSGVSNPTEAVAPVVRPLSKLALLSSKGRTAAAIPSPSKPKPPSGGLSKLAQKVQASRLASTQPAVPDSLQMVDTPPSWDISTPESRETLKAARPSPFAAILLNSHGANATRMREGDHTINKAAAPPLFNSTFKFDTPSPDELVLQARRGTSLAPRSPPSK